MFRPRIIPVLLLHNGLIVKSEQFKKYTYIGDPLNAVRIFNELMADELIILDIDASKKKQVISLQIVKEIAEEAMMPFSVGGGINDTKQIRNILAAGVEKVIIGSHAIVDPSFIKRAADEFGSSAITVCIDCKKNFWGQEKVWSMNGTKESRFNPTDFAQLLEENGAGELIVQSIGNDGMMTGYNLNSIKNIAEKVSIPVVALGGAGCLLDLQKARIEGNATGLAAGSIFVYYDKSKAVLINYPNKNEIKFFSED
jgi:imidazole glycerol-phosphate synthase subunit HisF